MRLRLAALSIALTVGATVPGAAGRRQDAPDDGVGLLLTRLERAIERGEPAAYEALLTDAADRRRLMAFLASELRPGVTRAVVRERDRSPLAGTLPGDGYRLFVDAFEEFGGRARSAAWQLDVRRGGGAE